MFNDEFRICLITHDGQRRFQRIFFVMLKSICLESAIGLILRDMCCGVKRKKIYIRIRWKKHEFTEIYSQCSWASSRNFLRQLEKINFQKRLNPKLVITLVTPDSFWTLMFFPVQLIKLGFLGLNMVRE